MKIKMNENKYSKGINTDSSGLNCTTYDLTMSVGDKKSNSASIGMPSSLNNNNSEENLAIEPVMIETEKLSKLM
jgi:hypothetical protein